MSDIARGSGKATPAGEVTLDEQARINEAMGILDGWKTRIDELRVQVDLAKLELQDQAARQLELARTVNAAAAPKLRDAYHDAASTAETLRLGVHEFLHDVNGAFDAVQAVIARD